MALVCSAGVALGQPTAIPNFPPSNADPTALTPVICEHYNLPAYDVGTFCEECCGFVSWQWDIFTNTSWVLTNPAWHRDRRPAVTIQFASNGFTQNPRALVDWWWITQSGATTLAPDLPIDEKRPNPDPNSNIELVGTFNGIPDQFDVLIRRIKLAHSKGIRRVIFHNPGGDQGVHRIGWSPYNSLGQRFAIYGGTNQSMNQFLGMPAWKQKYFRSNPANPVYYDYIDANGHGAQRLMDFAWGQFINDFCTTTPDLEPDKMSIEVYVGGGIGSQTCKLNTEPTVLNPLSGHTYEPHQVNSFLRWDPESPNQPVYRRMWSEPTISLDYPRPLDPRDPFLLSAFWSEIKPWSDTGIKTVWLDAASQNTPTDARLWGTVELSHHPFLTGQNIRLGGETIPTVDTIGWIPDDCSISHMRWYTNSQTVMSDYSQPTRTFKPAFQFSKVSTECHLFESSSLPLRWHEWREARRRGFVVGLYFGQFSAEIEKLKRWYSMGDIQVADFNADNEVNQVDYNDAWNATHMTDRLPTDALVFATGDILQNSDNLVNEDDWNTFLQYWEPANRNNVRAYQFRD